MMDFQRATVYQIYPKSFQDSNGDGIGDLPGVIRRLDYLNGLGVDYIWLTPFFKSPQRDNGYDVADYRSIDPVYGTMQDFEELVRRAREMDMGIMLDMVFNHTSTDHPWFQAALDGDPHYKDYYIWQDPPADGSLPTNWESKFGGPVWEFVPRYNQYYLHLFDRTQADLNWENPHLRRELRDILAFWMSKGVKGFRFDVINLVSKPEKYENDYEGDGRRLYTDGPKIHVYLKELCTEANAAGMITVGEMSSTSMEQCVRYSAPGERELSMCFNFHHLKVDYRDQQKWVLQEPDFPSLKRLLNDWQTGMQSGGGWNALFWSNHDQPRILSRFGDDARYRGESAKMLAAMLYLTRGTPYIFQGEEIGMTNAHFTDIRQYADVESIQYYHILLGQQMDREKVLHILGERSRDNARTPMQWDASANGGFTTGTPWLSVNPNHTAIHAQAQVSDSGSIHAWYKALISLRKELDVISIGTYTPVLVSHEKVFAYRRDHEADTLLVVANFFGEDAVAELELGSPEPYRCLMSNYQPRQVEQTMHLRPYEVGVFYTDGTGNL